MIPVLGSISVRQAGGLERQSAEGADTTVTLEILFMVFPCHVVSFHVLSCHGMPCHTMPYQVMLSNARCLPTD